MTTDYFITEQNTSLNLRRTTGTQANGGQCCEYLAKRTLLLSHYMDTLTTSSESVLSMPLAEVIPVNRPRDIKLLLLVKKNQKKKPLSFYFMFHTIATGLPEPCYLDLFFLYFLYLFRGCLYMFRQGFK